MANKRDMLPQEDIMSMADQFIESLPCHAPGPYPEVHVTRPDPDFGVSLLDAFANGMVAEVTAVAQYIHHHLTIPEKEISNLELCIAMVEMLHLSRVGEMLDQLGVDPRYWRANFGYWQGSNVMYGKDTCERLRIDIDSERAAINGYRRLIGETSDPNVIAVLQRIVEDEEVHERLFREALDKYCRMG